MQSVTCESCVPGMSIMVPNADTPPHPRIRVRIQARPSALQNRLTWMSLQSRSALEQSITVSLTKLSTFTSTVSLGSNSIRLRVVPEREKWSSCCRPTRIWHTLRLLRGRRPAIQERISTRSVVAVDTSRNLTCCVQTADRL